ncbi:hypothetical protein ACWDYB_06640, partial [Streptomyces sp. NPDC003299]
RQPLEQAVLSLHALVEQHGHVVVVYSRGALRRPVAVRQGRERPIGRFPASARGNGSHRAVCR